MIVDDNHNNNDRTENNNLSNTIELKSVKLSKKHDHSIGTGGLMGYNKSKHDSVQNEKNDC